MQVNELLCFQLNECDRAWGKLKAAAVVVTPLADCLQCLRLLCPFILMGDGGWSPERKVNCPLCVDGGSSLSRALSIDGIKVSDTSRSWQIQSKQCSAWIGSWTIGNI